MRVFHGFENLPSFRSPAATVGSYDGVHSGHRVLLDRIRREAAAVGGESIVLTFAPHPRVTLGTQERLRLLTSLEEKIYLLDRFGIDNLIVIPFDRAFSRIPSESFVKDYLIGKVGVKNLVVGFNHRFGHDKEGDYRLLNGLHDEFGFRVTEIEKQDVDAEKVSSTVIRPECCRIRICWQAMWTAQDISPRERLSSCFRLRVNIPCGSKVGPVCFG